MRGRGAGRGGVVRGGREEVERRAKEPRERVRQPPPPRAVAALPVVVAAAGVARTPAAAAAAAAAAAPRGGGGGGEVADGGGGEPGGEGGAVGGGGGGVAPALLQPLAAREGEVELRRAVLGHRLRDDLRRGWGWLLAVRWWRRRGMHGGCGVGRGGRGPWGKARSAGRLVRGAGPWFA